MYIINLTQIQRCANALSVIAAGGTFAESSAQVSPKTCSSAHAGYARTMPSAKSILSVAISDGEDSEAPSAALEPSAVHQIQFKNGVKPLPPRNDRIPFIIIDFENETYHILQGLGVRPIGENNSTAKYGK